MVTIRAVISAYTRKKSIDTVSIDEKIGSCYPLRSRFSDDRLPDKVITSPEISVPMANPLELTGLKANPTPIQMRVMIDVGRDNAFRRYGSLAYRASCGSGKTIAGLLCIYKLHLKTLIISTRNAVIDQWVTNFNSLYPGVKIWHGGCKGEPDDSYDVWIMTPNYINQGTRLETMNIRPGLIIYDEVHTMMSSSNYTGRHDSDVHDNEHANVLKLPFLRAMNDWGELPYLLSLSATYPEGDGMEKVIELIFGPVRHASKDAITDIRVGIFDLRRSYLGRGECDTKWHRPTEHATLSTFFTYLFEEGPRNTALLGGKSFPPEVTALVSCSERIIPSLTRKGIVMTGSIDGSVWAGLTLWKNYGFSVLILRTSDQKSIFLDGALPVREKFVVDKGVKYSEFVKTRIGEASKEYRQFIPRAMIIASTYQRVQEGFSVPELVWGISSEFVWSPLSRTQLVGRIRRSTTDEELNKFPRRLYVCSGPMPSNKYANIRAGRASAKVESTYSVEVEERLFAREGYFYMNVDKSL